MTDSSTLTHQFLRFLTVLLRPLLKVQVVEQAHHAPEILFCPKALFLGKPSHNMLHSDGVAQMERLLIVLGQQAPGLFS